MRKDNEKKNSVATKREIKQVIRRMPNWRIVGMGVREKVYLNEVPYVGDRLVREVLGSGVEVDDVDPSPGGGPVPRQRRAVARLPRARRTHHQLPKPHPQSTNTKVLSALT